VVCVPATLVTRAVAAVELCPVKIGGQDCHALEHGAHTGDISAEMLKDAGAVAVIVGHSERRAGHGERDRDVRRKAEAAHRAGLAAIVCIGETEGERAAGLTLEVVRRQLQGSLPEGARAEDTAVAYEPVWAIGTGRTATGADAAAMAGVIRATLADLGVANPGDVPVLYGGSVTSAAIDEFMAEPAIDGALVGGASLKPDEMAGIVARAGVTAAARGLVG
jgi:triosephosphate isomerase